jgi:hypothetical protein
VCVRVCVSDISIAGVGFSFCKYEYVCVSVKSNLLLEFIFPSVLVLLFYLYSYLPGSLM